jgi:hypothetical protein
MTRLWKHTFLTKISALQELPGFWRLTAPRTAFTVKRSQKGKFDRQGKSPVYRSYAAASHGDVAGRP